MAFPKELVASIAGQLMAPNLPHLLASPPDEDGLACVHSLAEFGIDEAAP